MEETNTQEVDLDSILIDMETASEDDFIREIERIQKNAEFYGSTEQSIKLFLNSTYGATSNEGSLLYDLRIAESITLQGRQMTRFASHLFDTYFSGVFQQDEELHKKLGISHSLASNLTIKIPELRNTFGDNTIERYSDTDSVYMTLGFLIDQLQIPNEESINFILKLQKEGIDPYFQMKYDEYAKTTNALVNTMSFELEKISYFILFFAKKNYIMNLAWKEPDIYLDPFVSITNKGVESTKSSTSTFARKELQKFNLWAIEKEMNKKLTLEIIIDYLNEVRKRFESEDIDNICPMSKVNKLDEKVHIDFIKNTVTFEPFSTRSLKGAGYYNYVIKSDKQASKKYQVLKAGDKVKYYETISSVMPIFSYIPGNYPCDVPGVPKFDYSIMFEKTILKPVNRLLEILHFRPLTAKMFENKKDTGIVPLW